MDTNPSGVSSGPLSSREPCQMSSSHSFLTVASLGRASIWPGSDDIVPEATRSNSAQSRWSESQAVAQVRLAMGRDPHRGLSDERTGSTTEHTPVVSRCKNSKTT